MDEWTPKGITIQDETPWSHGQQRVYIGRHTKLGEGEIEILTYLGQHGATVYPKLTLLRGPNPTGPQKSSFSRALGTLRNKNLISFDSVLIEDPLTKKRKGVRRYFLTKDGAEVVESLI